jgi:di/tricarboxylate transporter
VIFGLNPQQLTFVVILVLAFALLITEKIRSDVVALLIVVALVATGVTDNKTALSGFSSEPAIVIAAVFVVSAALHRTGLTEMVARWIAERAGSSTTGAMGLLMLTSVLLSAFKHHVTTVAMMLPVALDLADRKQLPPSKLLMPLSIGASLGTTITIIGAPAFLVSSELLRQAGRPGLGVFSIAPLGIAISVVGMLFVLAFQWLLPSRPGTADASSRFRLEDYFTELTILPESPFKGKRVADLEADENHHFTAVGLVRNGHRFNGTLKEEELREGDVLLVRTTPDEIIAFREARDVELHPAKQYESDMPSPDGHGDDDLKEQLVQAVVAPQSELVGRTLGQVDFRRRYGAVVLSLWRREGWLDEELSKTRLRAGDVLVMQGEDDAIQRVNQDRSFLMLVPFEGEPRRPRMAWVALLIMVAAVVVSAFEWLPLEIAFVAGAVAVVLTGCLNGRQAYNAIDQRIFVFIAGAIPLGTAMEKTGVSKLIAGWLQGATAGWPQVLVLLAIFAVVGVLTQFMSDAATTAIFAPVAIALAQALGHAPEAFVITVAMAAVTAFLTPIGHHGNLLVYGPGGYRFGDFVKIGTPMTLVIGLVVAFLSPMIWPA